MDLLGDELVAPQVVGVHRAELRVDARSPGLREGERAEVRQNVDTHWGYPELNDEVWIEQRLYGNVARRRTTEEVRKCLDESLRVGPGGRHEQIQVFSRAWPGVQSQRVGSADEIPYSS